MGKGPHLTSSVSLPPYAPCSGPAMLLATMGNWAFQVIFLQWPLVAFMVLPCDHFQL